MSGRSNCHLEAWREYRAGRAQAFCFHPTRYSRVERIVRHPLMLPVRLMGAMLQWTCFPLQHAGELLRSGRWYHVTWIDDAGRHWEYVPSAPKRARFLPPLVFCGRVQRVSDGRADATGRCSRSDAGGPAGGAREQG